MAIYHLTIRGGSRTKGTVAAHKLDYIQREKRYEKQPDGCIFKTSGNRPRWAEDPRDYWQAADQYERVNGRLFVEVEFALPRELSHKERVELAQGFAHALTHEHRFPYTLAVHEGKGANPHAHLIISERMNDGIERSPWQWFRRANRQEPERGGALKSRVFHGSKQVERVRELWAREANQALERAGSRELISHRSLRDQGITRAPTVHIGPASFGMARRGVISERARELAEARLRVVQVERELASVTRQLGELAEERRQERARERSRGLELG